MKLKVIAKYKDGKPSDLTLYKERMTVKNGELFEIPDEERANEILSATFQGNAVVEVVDEEQDIQKQDNNTQDANNNDDATNNSNLDNIDNDNETLNDLTVNELKELAAQKGIELTATKKDDIVSEIESAMTNVNDDLKNNEDKTKDETMDEKDKENK